MDDKANELLSQLQEQMRHNCFVSSIDDINVGDIIYYDMDKDDGITPSSGYSSRKKYVVVAGSNRKNEVCAVLINSNNRYASNSDLFMEQYLIRKVDYPDILDYNSWIDCANIKILKVPKIISKGAEKKSKLNQLDLSHVMRHLRENDFIKPSIRRDFGILSYTIDN